MTTITRETLIAPCGMNCGICMAYLRDKNHCPGCRVKDANKAVSTQRCKIINCEDYQNGNLKYCFDCERYPCIRIKNLDKRYRTKYNMSMIENLGNIKESGIELFVQNEAMRWTCSECGGTVNVHRGCCFSCGAKR
jgi:hypothetical protein